MGNAIDISTDVFTGTIDDVDVPESFVEIGNRLHDGSVVPAAMVIEIPVRKGSGTWKSATVPSVWLKVCGTVKITEPKEGTWRIRIVDTIKNELIFDRSGIPANLSINFEYKTAFRFQASVEVWWSEPRDTDLKATLDYKIC